MPHWMPSEYEYQYKYQFKYKHEYFPPSSNIIDSMAQLKWNPNIFEFKSTNLTSGVYIVLVCSSFHIVIIALN